MEPEAPVYERIVLKLSGEAMQHGGRDNISAMLIRVAEHFNVPRGWLARLKALFR